ANPDLDDYPDWYHGLAIKRNIVGHLKPPGADPALIYQYFELYQRDKALGLGRVKTRPEDTLADMVYVFGTETVGHAYAAEPIDGALHATLESTLEREANS